MVLNYLKLAVRLLIRSPFFTFINILGLSVGFTVFFILSQHSSFELRSDQFHRDHERIFRIYFDLYHDTGVEWAHMVSGALPPVFTTIVKEKYTEVETATRIIHQTNFDQVRWAGAQTDTAGWSELNPKMIFSITARDGEKHSFIEKHTVYADPNLFDFFSIPVLIGKPRNVLSRADKIVLSASTARKYFGEADPTGKLITLNDSLSFTVSGVFQDLPNNSHLNFKIVLSTLGIQHATENVHPFMRSSQNYLKVREGISLAELEKKLNEEQKIHWDFTTSFPGSTLTFFLKPLKEVPFHVFDNDVFTPKSRYIAKALQLVAIVVLMMAWINYINLKLSMQTRRMKELAARKTAGASKKDFIKQFLIESLLINGIAILIAFTLVQLTAGLLEIYFQFYLPDWDEMTISTAMVFVVMMVMGFLIGGLLPAISVWRMTTHKILVHRKSTGTRTAFVHVSTVVQFVCAIALIVWLYSVSKQVDFITSDTWGIDRSRVIVMEMPEMSGETFPSNVNYFKNKLLSSAGIEDVALSTTVAGDLVDNPIGFHRTDTANVWVVSKSDGGVDERFLPFYSLKLLAGRNFLPDNPADKRSVILSRQAAQNVGLNPETAIGKIVWIGKYPWRPFGTEAQIIGVIEEHRYNPLYLESGISNANRGTILTYGDFLFPKNKPLKLSIRIDSENIGQTIEMIQKQCASIFPGHLFHWYFLDDHMNAHYQSENIARNQILLFTCIAIAIACLGLLGMISNHVAEKTKEIGIRKVLGAEMHQIAQILLSTTIKQTIISTLIGIPVAFFLTQQYLEKFSDRIHLQWWHFMLPIGILISLLFLTVAFVLWKATRTNPVESLRYE